MGIGSALSLYPLNRGLVYRFVWIELLLGVIGGFFFRAPDAGFRLHAGDYGIDLSTLSS